MPQTEPKKIAYLFGAGATHSELINLYQEVPEKLGLLTSNVSDRVIKRAKRAARYLKGVEMVTPESGSLNIELLISLIEGSKRFVSFYIALLKEIKDNLILLSHYEKPTNSTVLEEFQKYISQASVESYAIKRRNLFLEKGFSYYLNPKTKGKIIGST
jgi:hypothetical protein